MFLQIFGVFAIVQCVFSQGIILKNGNVGVEFGGYSASAGLGGLLTGNAAHGGLQASAGTPGGQRAVAGLGGNTGDLSGGLYAGATAGKGIGASAGLGGNANSGAGLGGAEAHAGGVSKTASVGSATATGSSSVASPSSGLDSSEENTVVQQTSVVRPAVNIQKTYSINRPRPQPLPIRPISFGKIFSYNYGPIPSNPTAAPVQQIPIPQPQPALYQKRITYQPITYRKEVQTRIQDDSNAGLDDNSSSSSSGSSSSSPAAGTYTIDHGAYKQAFFNDIFNIPISALRSVNTLLNNKFANGGYSVQKTVNYN